MMPAADQLLDLLVRRLLHLQAPKAQPCYVYIYIISKLKCETILMCCLLRIVIEMLYIFFNWNFDTVDECHICYTITNR